MQGPTGLKNLLREAHQWLHKAGIDTRTTKDCSDPPNRCGKTMSEIAGENNTTTFLPLPIELFTPFLNRASDDSGKKV